MATKKRAGLGRGLSALIPQAPVSDDRAIDVFFNGSAPTGRQETSNKIDPAIQIAQNDSLGSEAGLKKGTPKSSDSPPKSGSKSARPTTNGDGRPASSGGKLTESKSTTDTHDASIIVDAETSEVLEATHGIEDSETLDNTTEIGPGGSNDFASKSIDDAETTISNRSTGIDTGPVEDLLPVPGAQLGDLDPFRIVANTRQPRIEFDQDALEELTHSVREFGVFQPIVVRPLAEDDPRRSEGEYELIMGERRLRATKASGRATVPAIIRHTDDDDMLRDALLENLHRADLNPLEEASAYQQLLNDFGCSQQELSDRIGRSRPRISNTIRLLKLPVDIQRKVAAGVLSAGHARAILSVGEPAAMTQLANKIINENLTVREAEMAAATMSIRTDKPSSKQAPVGSDSLNAHLSTVGERLGDRLNTRVKVVLRKTKGQISIDFASVADLNRILEAIGEPSEA